MPLIEHIEVRWDKRGKGYGTRLLKDAETLIRQKSLKVCARVNVCSENGGTLPMLIRNGYFPDGNGATEGLDPLMGGRGVHNMDEVYLWLLKDFAAQPQQPRVEAPTPIRRSEPVMEVPEVPPPVPPTRAPAPAPARKQQTRVSKRGKTVTAKPPKPVKSPPPMEWVTRRMH